MLTAPVPPRAVVAGKFVTVALIGVIGFGALLMYAGIRAFFNSPGMYYAPGKARREWKAEQEAARRAEQRRAGREE